MRNEKERSLTDLIVKFIMEGKEFSSNVTKTQALISLSQRTPEVMALTVDLAKSDVREMLDAYKNVRKVSPQRAGEYEERFTKGTWIKGYPTIMIDSNGDVANGGHVMTGFLDSTKEVQTFVVLIGIDPAIMPHIDRNKTRSLLDQMGVIPDVRKAMDRWKGKYDGNNFAAAASHIFSMAIGWDVAEFGDLDMTQPHAKVHMLEFIEGQNCAKLLLPAFEKVKKIIERAEAEAIASENEGRIEFTEGLRKGQVYIPFLMFLVRQGIGKPAVRVIESLITGEGSMSKNLKDCREELQRIVRKSNENGRRDTEEVLHGAFTILSYLYSELSGNARYVPPPRWGTRDRAKSLAEKNGITLTKEQKRQLNMDDEIAGTSEVKLWEFHTEEQRQAYFQFRHTAAEFFLSGMDLTNDPAK